MRGVTKKMMAIASLLILGAVAFMSAAGSAKNDHVSCICFWIGIACLVIGTIFIAYHKETRRVRGIA